MPMARALRRTLSPQTKECHSGCNSMSSSGASIILQNGGVGGVVFSVEKTYDHSTHSPHNHVSSLTSLSGGIDGPINFSCPSLHTSASHSEKLFWLPHLSFVFPLSWLRFMGRTGGSGERLLKSRGTFLRKPMMHLLLCLVLGIVVGFTPIRWSDLSSPAEDGSPRDLGLENGFVTNLQREGGHTVSRGEKLIEVDSWQGGSVGEVTSSVQGEDNSRAFETENLGSGLLEVAPGLNYTLDPERKLLIIITPTYNRAFQAHYLTRLAHTLRLVPPPLLWLVVEMPYQTLETAAILRQTGIMYRHLVCRNNVTNFKDRGVHQRNFALEHIQMHQLNGIVYFADDDNVYSEELFEQMRKIRRFGTWPVGMMAESKAKTVVEGPVCNGNKVIGWHTNEKSKRLRRFHVDMSGFAFNSTILWDSSNWRHRSEEPIRQLDTVKEGLQETTFIEQLVEDEDQMEGLPSGCNKIMVWHLQMEAPELAYPYGWSLAKHLHPNIPLQTQI